MKTTTTQHTKGKQILETKKNFKVCSCEIPPCWKQKPKGVRAKIYPLCYVHCYDSVTRRHLRIILRVTYLFVRTHGRARLNMDHHSTCVVTCPAGAFFVCAVGAADTSSVWNHDVHIHSKCSQHNMRRNRFHSEEKQKMTPRTKKPLWRDSKKCRQTKLTGLHFFFVISSDRRFQSTNVQFENQFFTSLFVISLFDVVLWSLLRDGSVSSSHVDRCLANQVGGTLTFNQLPLTSRINRKWWPTWFPGSLGILIVCTCVASTITLSCGSICLLTPPLLSHNYEHCSCILQWVENQFFNSDWDTSKRTVSPSHHWQAVPWNHQFPSCMKRHCTGVELVLSGLR